MNTATQMSENTSEDTESESSKFELNPGYEGETISLKEACDITGKSKVTILKTIKEKGIKPVGQIRTQKRGRPANLLDRVELLAALHSG